MAGGEPGALGAGRVERADGTVTVFRGSDSADAGPGDVLVIEPPRRRGPRPTVDRSRTSRRRDR
jgi:5-oxoprolinase (ATP-hydrolysing)